MAGVVSMFQTVSICRILLLKQANNTHFISWSIQTPSILYLRNPETYFTNLSYLFCRLMLDDDVSATSTMVYGVCGCILKWFQTLTSTVDTWWIVENLIWIFHQMSWTQNAAWIAILFYTFHTLYVVCHKSWLTLCAASSQLEKQGKMWILCLLCI